MAPEVGLERKKAFEPEVKLSDFTSENKLIREKYGGRIPVGFLYPVYPVLYPVSDQNYPELRLKRAESGG